MVDSDFVRPGDECQVNPLHCENGLSFSIWEKITYDSNILLDTSENAQSKKYIISSGADYDPISGKAYPGFAIYHQGVDLVGVVSTGEEVWELRVTGQLHNDTWHNIGIRFKKPDLTDTKTPMTKLGGLELFVNLERVGHSLLPEFTEAGSSSFSPVEGYTINGAPPPVVMVGCHYDHANAKFDHFSGAEFDEIALWSRKLGTNATHDETIFFFGGFEAEFTKVNPQQFKALLNNADLANDHEAEIANEILEAMLLTQPTTVPPIPTRTTVVGGNGSQSGSTTPSTGNDPKTTTDPNVKSTTSTRSRFDMAKSMLALQNVMSTMLNVDKVSGIKPPSRVEMRFPLAIVASKIVAGSKANIDKWKAVYEEYPEMEGAPRTIRELQEYMVAWVGATNTSSDEATNFFKPDRDAMEYATSGEDFVMNAYKLPPREFRREIRLRYPNYDGLEWLVNKGKWDNPKDTFTVPTGMFKNQEGCNDIPVSFVTSIFNNLAQVFPRKRNPSLIRGDDWEVDSKVITVNVGASVNSLDYDEADLETVKQCRADPDYMRDNPIRATFYHKQVSTARLLSRQLTSTWFSSTNRDGVEVRHCVWWNEGFGSSGAWDPVECKVVETSEEKTTCECREFGSFAVIRELSQPIEIDDDCVILQILKYIGIGCSIILLSGMILVIVGSKKVWDMFHVLRMNIGICWIFAIILHILSDVNSIRDDKTSNLVVGFLMMYCYTASAIWTFCEAHATFKAFTAGIISGRTKIYYPLAYGAPFIPLGVFFILYNEDLGLDPRCFVGWNDEAKAMYILFNVGVSLGAVACAIVILFNMSRPQTKRSNVVIDLRSQAHGTAWVSFITLFLWIFAGITYLHDREGDQPDPYCIFSVLLGWFGVVLFLLLGLASRKFRLGVKSRQPPKVTNSSTNNNCH